MKIDEQPRGGMGELKVSKYNGFMYWAGLLDGFQLHNNSFFDQQVDSISTFEFRIFVDYGNGFLALEGYAAQREPAGKALFLD